MIPLEPTNTASSMSPSSSPLLPIESFLAVVKLPEGCICEKCHIECARTDTVLNLINKVHERTGKWFEIMFNGEQLSHSKVLDFCDPNDKLEFEAFHVTH